MNFDFICKIYLEFSKMGITFAYELGLKSFLYEKSSTWKVTFEFNQGNPVGDFQNPQKPKWIKDTGLLRSRGGKMEKKFELSNGAPFARCATSNKKNHLQKKIWFFFQNMIRNMTGKFEIFFKISSYSWTWTKS